MVINLRKKGQISIEIMYSVGVLLLIFIMLSSVTFTKKLDVERTRETVLKKNDCVMISNALQRVATLGDGYESWFKTYHKIDILESGLIIVGDIEDGGTSEIEIICSFNGVLYNAAYSLIGDEFTISNTEGVLNIAAV